MSSSGNKTKYAQHMFKNYVIPPSPRLEVNLCALVGNIAIFHIFILSFERLITGEVFETKFDG